MSAVSGARCSVLITGGAGFIGANLAARLIAGGERVRILDALLRPGSEQNIAWLQEQFGDSVEFVRDDVRNSHAVAKAMEDVEHVVHLAAQVAVTRSLEDPAFDFDVNARGTLNVLEALRRHARPPSLLFTSTNKVYGALDDLRLHAQASRYAPANPQVLEHGIAESRSLDFHSPYGCSKGAADQYVLDFARSYGLRTVVFRMSCIYGPHQFGNEDQGWVAHIARAALTHQPITIYGDGRQVRDVLFVDDLVNAFGQARRQLSHLSGRAFNIGGGAHNTLSLLELLQLIEQRLGYAIEPAFADWRVGDQRYYVSDTRSFSKATGWRAQIGIDRGLSELCDWFRSNEPQLANRTVATPSESTLGARL